MTAPVDRRAGGRDLIDPELRAVIEPFSMPPPSEETLRALRQAPWPPVELSGRVERTEHSTDGPEPVPVRVHRPLDPAETGSQLGARPGLLSIHGGGLLFGTYDMDDPLLDRWCSRFGLVGVSVQYRLAPDFPYPTPLEDCYSALRWMHDHAGDLGIDSTRIGVYGISAGGGLAAALALLARDRGEFPLAFQLLDCPMLDDRPDSPSMQSDDLYVWTREWNEFGWRSYLGEAYGTDGVDPYAAAGRAEDLSGLPPAFISVGSIDGFRDQDVEYAMRLNRAGVPCELHVYSGLPHGYSLAPDASAVKLAAADTADWLGRQLRRMAP
jgi:acetyl esterase/lipase